MTTPNGNDYRQYTQKEHIYEVPDTYVGSDEQIPRQVWVYDLESKRVSVQEVTLPSAVERLFLEILSNAGDNVPRSRQCGMNPGSIVITMDETTISVLNQGRAIPVDINDQTGLYAPEMIFSYLLTSSNYDKTQNREGAGRNGYGAKLTNIFSKFFKVEVGDESRKKSYVQYWTENMEVRSEPIIAPYTGASYVRITYTLDFARFKYEDKYPEEAMKMFAYHALAASANHRVPVFFNNQDLTVDIKSYGETIFGPELVQTAFTHLEWPVGTEIQNHRKGLPTAKNPLTVPTVEILAVDTPYQSSVISFINGIPTFTGGFHVDSTVKMLSDAILEIFNGAKKKSKEDKTPRLTMADVRPHLSLIVICRVPNPKFTSQSKDYCPSYALTQNPDEKPISAIKWSIPKETKIFKIFESWQILHQLQGTLEAKNNKHLSKTDGKKRKHIMDAKLIDANEAGTNRSHECILYLVEGDSAANYAERIYDLNPAFRDVVGIFPMKGKPLNAMNAGFKQYSENKVFIGIKDAIGLREGLDYSVEGISTLRYGRVVIMPDADDDGKHICGLALNFFFCRFPSLLKIGYVLHYRSPIIRVKNEKYFTQEEFEIWVREHPAEFNKLKKNEIHYLKGLGSSTKTQAIEDLKNPKMVLSILDEQAPQMFNLSFNREYSDYRKDWIAKSIGVSSLEAEKMEPQPISMYLHYEYVKYMIDNLHRSIPNLMDGLKISQRKVLYTAFHHWKSSSENYKIVKNPERYKVGQLAPETANYSRYHHGELGLTDVIVNMASEFVGSNNMCYFVPDGQFGERTNGGKASAARYIHTTPEWWLNYVYKKEDDPLLTPVIDDGEEVEPEFYLPIIPMQMINGVRGIGSGSSTFMPNHHPLQVVDWLLNKLSDKDVTPLIPWYRGFTGEIAIKVRNGKQLNEETLPQLEEEGNSEPEEPVEPEEIERLSMVTTGKFEFVGAGQVRITELPIGCWTNNYENFLKKLIQDKSIKDYKANCNSEIINFLITGFNNPTHQSLRLNKSYGMTNMVLLDREKKPTRYNTTTELMEEFYKIRLGYYELRKQHQLAAILKEIQTKDYRMQFIQLVNRGEIIVMKQKKEQIHLQMDKFGIPREIYTHIKVSALSEEEVEHLQREISDLKNQHQNLDSTSAKQLWITDLQEFRAAYVKHYKD